MGAERVDRVVVAVKNLEDVLDFFHDALDISFDRITQSDGLKLRAAVSPIGIEVVEPCDEESPIARFIARRGEGLHALVLKVKNLDSSKQRLEARGVRCVREVSRGGLREAIFHPKDLHGIQLVLCQYEAPHPARCAARHSPPL